MKRFLCVVAILAGLVAIPAMAGLPEDMAAMRAAKVGTGWRAADYGAQVVVKAQAILDAYPDLTAAQKLEIYGFVGQSYWEGAGDQKRGVEWYGKTLAATSSTATSDYDTRRAAKWMQGLCTAESGEQAAGLALLEEAWAMPKVNPAKADNLDWSIAYWTGVEKRGGGKVMADTLDAKLVSNPQFTGFDVGFPWNVVIANIIPGRFLVAGKWDAAGAAAYLAAHPFATEAMGADEWRITAEIKQAGGDLAGARDGFLECFRTLKRGGNPDVAIAAFQAIDNETMFKDAAEQTAFYTLLLRVVPATEGNAKFLGLVKSQIEAMK